KPGRTVVSVLPRTEVAPFSLVGISWLGTAAESTKFQVQLRESGKWSHWYTLSHHDDHGPDAQSSEAATVRSGTDPLITSHATGIRARAVTTNGALPQRMTVRLADSNTTPQDRALLAQRNGPTANAVAVPAYVVSPQGALVARPNLITRAQWGANESWRNEDPSVGTAIMAGFLHHTATTNSYSASEAPAQMRSLYAYFTKGLGYKDMAYNFLVDKYGNVYEGRSGCPRAPAPGASCDGPAVPAVGAHTAGLNTNTFAISAIGNYHTNKPTAAQAAKLVSAIAGLMAWKVAPYGVNAQANAKLVVGSDPKGKSRFNEGDLATIPTISGHRDAGKTVCPGKYLYPYLPKIREKVVALMQPAVKNAAITPVAIRALDPTNVTITATVPALATWSIDVMNPAGTVVSRAEGVQSESAGDIGFTWNHLDGTGALLPEGLYKVAINVVVGSTALPTFNSNVALASLPTPVTSVSRKRVSKTKSQIRWAAVANASPVSYKYRTKTGGKGKWSKWKYTTSAATKVTLKKLKRAKTYRMEIVATNALGQAPATTLKFKQ
ncbi:MAG: hypothetical protein F2839_05975, partial [Actinobacteria bacterium]|nr:hypothetical protein [Actinomycetota bacterium]